MKSSLFNTRIITPLLLFLMALAGCSGVNTQMDKSASRGSYNTYAWREPDVKSDNPLFKSDLIDKDIREDIENELGMKGLYHNEQDPDIYVQYHTFAEEVQQTSSNLYGYPSGYTGFSSMYGPVYGPLGYGAYGNGFSYVGGYYPSSTYTYTQETLIIDFIDAKTNKVVWRGSVDNQISDVSELDDKHEKGVHAILKKYPDHGHMVKHSD